MSPHATTTEAVAPALEVRGVSKFFPGVQALRNVDFTLRAGEVHALVGENGAGKSTFIKILPGALPKDAGIMRVFGQAYEPRSPWDALRAGISAIYQEFNLVPYLTVAENLFLGREPRRAGGLVDWRRLNAMARDVLMRLGMPLNPRAYVANLSVAGQQMVEIARALSVGARILLMDEPSAALTEHDLERLFEQVRRLRSQGVSVIYISHRLAEIFTIADRATVLRDGEVVGTRDVAGLQEMDLVRMMVGRQVETGSLAGGAPGQEPLLQVEGVSSGGMVHDCTFEVRAGEIAGIGGLVGSGRTELARAIFGAAPRTGRVVVAGKVLPPGSPRAAIRAGLGLLPEDRKLQGLLLRMLVRENITLANVGAVACYGFISARRERAAARPLIADLDIRPPETDRAVMYLSGGNQQKVVLARWLFTRSQVLILDEPTRGIDVGAKAEVHMLMRRLTDQGAALLVISSELPELLKVSDRILVMREGSIVGVLAREEATEEKVMALATGAVLP
ncbi:MAG: sugar ABC transporter ATP-binding protein [Armatimonadetes bacterium]|nr:sugar ABC transporter ATP-binding protein [Armatimonadota bacterium]